jgi:hypothetical protein
MRNRKLTAEQYVAEPIPGWPSVRSTIYHITLVRNAEWCRVSHSDDRGKTVTAWRASICVVVYIHGNATRPLSSPCRPDAP